MPARAPQARGHSRKGRRKKPSLLTRNHGGAQGQRASQRNRRVGVPAVHVHAREERRAETLALNGRDDLG
eukprot:6946034-Alexandrium_andersonii.AAC.1